MIEIVNPSGQVLELLPGTTIPVERYNSLFNSADKFIQDVTYPGKAGLTDNNMIFISNGHLVEASNEVYRIQVQVIVFGSHFFSGSLLYKITGDEIEYTLKVNFGVVADRVKKTNINEIITMDPDLTVGTVPALEARMKATCESPLSYPYVFFPVKNEAWRASEAEFAYPFINYWDHTSQRFWIEPIAVPGKSNETVQVPFFRVSYILKKVLECLKFDIGGGYFDDPDEQNIYFFNRIGMRDRGATGRILPSLSYMPEMKITDLFKQLAERRKISFEFDVQRNTVFVETPGSVLARTEVLEIHDYIESIDEIEPAESLGYEITLKIDESDEAWNTGTTDERIFTPPQKLHVGESETKIEMAIGTLASFEDTGYSYPVNKQLIDFNGSGTITDWPLAMLEYKGMKALGSGKFFPEAKPLDLRLSDADWYKFLTDSKQVVIYANLPPEVLANLKPTTKIGCISEQNYYFVALPVKISYVLATTSSNLIRVKIEARRMISEYSTQAFIEVVVPEQAGKRYIRKFKAFFDTDQTGVTQVRVERFPLTGSLATFGFEPITSSTDEVGLGGAIGMSYAITGSRTHMENAQDRLFSNVVPRYYIQDGVRGTFSNAGTYFTFDPLPGFPAPDRKPVWIVF